MKEFIENLISRLEEKKKMDYNTYVNYGMNVDIGRVYGIEEAIAIVNQLAEEYINCSTDTSSGWIPASEPPKCFMLSDGSLIPFLVCDKFMWHPYIAFYNGKEWFTALGKLNPTAYMPLPSAYVPKEGRE